MALSQRSTIAIQTWTSSSIPPQKYGGLRGCRTTDAGDARSFAAYLLEDVALGWMVLCSSCRGSPEADDAVDVSSRGLQPV